MRFSADDACMDVTRSHTVNIATHNLYAESGHLKNAETGLPNYKSMKPANTHTFNMSLKQFSVFFVFNSLFLHIVMETSMTASLKADMKETEVSYA